MEECSANIKICQEGHANALAMNKDSTQIAVAGRSLLKIFSVDGFTEVCNMRGGKNQNLSYSSNDVTWSHLDNNILATAATNGVVCIWDLTLFGRQKQKLVYQEHERTAHTVAFHDSDPNILISGSQDGMIKCFDLRVEKSAISTFMSNSESIRDVKFNPHSQNSFAAVSENGSVQIWDIKRPDRCLQQFTAHSGPIYTCDWHPTHANWLATGSRDKQIKVWNITTKPRREYTIHTIAAVGRVKWRPDIKYHIASCALVVDYSVHLWDVRRPFIPLLSFNDHTNVTTDIAFKSNEPNVLLSTSKDSTIFKHNFKDAAYPFLKANPQAGTINARGEILIGQRISVPLESQLSPAKTWTLDSMLVQFYQTTSNLYKIESLPNVGKLDLTKEYDDFREFASQYSTSGTFQEICRYNERVAKKCANENTALLWKFLIQLFDVYSNASPSHEKVAIPVTSSTKQTLPVKELVEKKEHFEERKPPKQTDESRFAHIELNDDVFGNTEINFENLSCVKKFRKGFLYIGNWQQEQVKEIEEKRIDAEEAFSRRNDESTELLKVTHDTHITLWDPYETLRNFLLLQVEHGDIQTTCTILQALQERDFEISIDESVQEYWLQSYIDLLHRHQLWNEAAVVIKKSHIPAIQEINQRSTSVQLGCGNCNRMIASSGAYYCGKCKSQSASLCAFCHLVVKGLYVYCLGCSHGGHLEHMEEWFRNNSKCPVCGHLCEYE